ncbi:hypothetical protein [Gracilibacillus saliphilus]|uniref:hypothetical protein n=1 Tax=Gracilibacillus saliphilus TaxID=543890 RepID=UPI001878CBA4|nr:hypothetical protein [Gracilibacillus saliphilus]
MLKFMKFNRIEKEPSVKLFEGERWLIITGIFGVILSLSIAFLILFQGHIKLPEGNMKDAFSFNAALGIFILSIAAILPLTRFSDRKRKVVRWFFIVASIYGYVIETVQNFRGINPRFSRIGTEIDMIAGILFGIISLVLVILAIILMIHFFRIKPPYERPLLLVGIRYAFLSVFVANVAGIWMILLQDRLTGDAGNLIVLHGLGFHALQTVTLPAWFLENTQIKDQIKNRLIHLGSIAWLLMILLIGIQTGFGRPVFELTILPIMASVILLIWLGAVISTFVFFMKPKSANNIPIDQATVTQQNR